MEREDNSFLPPGLRFNYYCYYCREGSGERGKTIGGGGGRKTNTGGMGMELGYHFKIRIY